MDAQCPSSLLIAEQNSTGEWSIIVEYADGRYEVIAPNGDYFCGHSI